MTNEQKRRIVCFFIGYLVGYVVCATTWAAFEYAGQRKDSARVSEYSYRSESAEELADSAEARLDSLAEQVRRAGTEVTECSTDIAELRIYGDRITEANKGIEDSAGRIEASVYRIMRIIEPG